MSVDGSAPSMADAPRDRCWPTQEQELLLRAALLQGEEALHDWETWKGRVDLADLDLASRRIFPQLYRNLHKHGVQDRLMRSFKEAFGRTYFQNHVLFDRGAAVVRSFHEAGIDTMLLKGSALISGYYEDPALRPMQDFDVLVPTKAARSAMAVLKRIGWRATYHARPEEQIAITHSVPFADPTNHQVDLHWHVLPDPWFADDTGFWSRSVPMEIRGIATRRLDSTDQLLHVCAHGVRTGEMAPIRWIADAMTILRSPGVTIDWERLVAEAKSRRLVLPVTAGLTYLRNRFNAPVPDAIIATLGAVPVTALERMVYAVETSPSRRLSTTEFARVLYSDFRRIGTNERGLRRLVVFTRRTANRWHGTPPWQLIVLIPWKILRRVAHTFFRGHSGSARSGR